MKHIASNIEKHAIIALRRFIRQQLAVTSIEYALLASLISLTLILAFTNAGKNVLVLYEKVSEAVSLSAKGK